MISDNDQLAESLRDVAENNVTIDQSIRELEEFKPNFDKRGYSIKAIGTSESWSEELSKNKNTCNFTVCIKI